MSEQAQRKPKPVLKLKTKQEEPSQQPKQPKPKKQKPSKKPVEVAVSVTETICDNPLADVAPAEDYVDILGYDDTHTKRKQARASKHSRSNNEHEYSRKESRWN